MTIPTLPAETVSIAPEHLTVADAYLTLNDIDAVAAKLGIPISSVSAIIERREVQAYINRVFMDAGYNNRTKMRQVLDTLIETKLQELAEAGVGSNKDILDILTLSHKFTMEYLNKEIELKKLDMGKPSNQFNVQINNEGGSNYLKLLETLMGGRDVNSQP